MNRLPWLELPKVHAAYSPVTVLLFSIPSNNIRLKLFPTTFMGHDENLLYCTAENEFHFLWFSFYHFISASLAHSSEVDYFFSSSFGDIHKSSLRCLLFSFTTITMVGTWYTLRRYTSPQTICFYFCGQESHPVSLSASQILSFILIMTQKQVSFFSQLNYYPHSSFFFHSQSLRELLSSK
jgi:hypothetical protein